MDFGEVGPFCCAWGNMEGTHCEYRSMRKSSGAMWNSDGMTSSLSLETLLSPDRCVLFASPDTLVFKASLGFCQCHLFPGWLLLSSRGRHFPVPQEENTGAAPSACSPFWVSFVPSAPRMAPLAHPLLRPWSWEVWLLSSLAQGRAAPFTRVCMRSWLFSEHLLRIQHCFLRAGQAHFTAFPPSPKVFDFQAFPS